MGSHFSSVSNSHLEVLVSDPFFFKNSAKTPRERECKL